MGDNSTEKIRGALESGCTKTKGDNSVLDSEVQEVNQESASECRELDQRWRHRHSLVWSLTFSCGHSYSNKIHEDSVTYSVTYQIKLIGAKAKLRKRVSINWKGPLSYLLMAILVFCQSLRGKRVKRQLHGKYAFCKQRQKINRPREAQSPVFSYTFSLPFAT